MEGLEAPIYERQAEAGESSVWYSRFLLYRNMPAIKRNLLGAARLHQERTAKGAHKPYRTTPGSWRDHAERWQWIERAAAYDDMLHAEAEARAEVLRELEAEEERRILSTGYALKHRRIEKLTQAIQLIDRSFLDDEGKIEYRFVSADKIRELRGALDDIAKEMGDRARKTELTGRDGEPVEIEIITEWAGGALDEN
jgi:hypothetical protein